MERLTEIVKEQKALLDGEIVVTVVRDSPNGVIVDAGHATLVVAKQRLELLA